MSWGKKNKIRAKALIGAVCQCKEKPDEIASPGADNLVLAPGWF